MKLFEVLTEAFTHSVGDTVKLMQFDAATNRRTPTEVKITKITKDVTGKMKVSFTQKGKREKTVAMNVFKSKMVNK